MESFPYEQYLTGGAVGFNVLDDIVAHFLSDQDVHYYVKSQLLATYPVPESEEITEQVLVALGGERLRRRLLLHVLETLLRRHGNRVNYCLMAGYSVQCDCYNVLSSIIMVIKTALRLDEQEQNQQVVPEAPPAQAEEGASTPDTAPEVTDEAS